MDGSLTISEPLYLVPIYAFIATLILGPLMFYWFGKAFYKKKKLRTYPLYLADGIGDTIFLPWYNAMLAGYGLSFVNPYIAVAGALAVTVGWMTYRLFFNKTRDWTMPKHAHFSFGGWYHLGFFFIQTLLIVTGILEHSTNIWVLLPLIIYMILALITLGLQSRRRRTPHKK